MAGPEGFDASLIETEALLKRMKPRPANLSAARIVYEAGRAVGKEEMQAQLVGGGMAMAALPAASWKKWVIPAWAGGATAVCLLLLLVQYGFRGSRREPTPDYLNLGVSAQAVSPGEQYYNSPGYNSPGPTRITPQSAAEQYASQPSTSDIDDQAAEKPIGATQAPHNSTTTTASSSANESGPVRQGRAIGEPKKREKNIAEYIRDQLPSLESRRNLDPLEIRNGVLPQSGSGSPMALTTLGFIKSP